MHGAWLQDIESLEAISQDGDTRRICLRLAALSHTGAMGSFLAHVAHDQDLDPATKAAVTELAGDPAFLYALEDYLLCTERAQ
jgi:hypothetical protein